MNGTSSAGKSGIVRELVRLLDGPLGSSRVSMPRGDYDAVVDGGEPRSGSVRGRAWRSSAGLPWSRSRSRG
ncbi:chloramphenicol phosphotransferase CPT family protein [Streptomyces albus]|nr:chloramphenicol phosphotransferase CPT family protein [Streptomyces albus]